MPKVLVIGSGAREQALAWKLAQSKHVDKVFVAPGNGGSSGKIKNVNINYDKVKELLNFAKNNSVSLSVVGQEAASAAGVVDEFTREGLKVFGPTKAAVKIETSKSFSKDLMTENKIPTARYKSFEDPAKAQAYALKCTLPVVIKADGLATGKGVIIASTKSEVIDAIDTLMVKKSFGGSGNTVVIEEFVKGVEISVHALCDGKSAIVLPISMDHKQINDGDKGPNTGGMGVIAPIDWITDKRIDEIYEKVINPALRGMKQLNAPFKGVLYPGLMIDGDKMNVLEFNARFGDPEAECYMRLLKSDLYEVLLSCVEGNLDKIKIKWENNYAVSIVLAAKGYPGKHSKGDEISGILEASKLKDVVVFHAGTEQKNGKVYTSGGRVLNVTATGKTVEIALKKAYKAIESITFNGMQFRKDIGKRSVK